MRCPKCRRKNPDNYLYCASCGTPLGTGGGEKRFATVLFYDLSGYTRYLHEKGPDLAWLEAEKAFRIAKEIIEREGGRPHTTYGDGVLAVFGLQPSRGSEAEKALRAAVAIVEESERLYRAGEMQLRGRAVVTSGLVLVMPTLSRNDLFGDPLNRAQRMIAATPPGLVYLDETTLDLVSGLKTTPLPPMEAKGFPDPLKAFRFEGFVRRHASLPTAAALEELEAAWEGAQRGRGQVAVLVGAPGSGKRLLLNAFLEDKDPAQVVRLPPLPPHVSIRGWLRGFFEGAPEFKQRLERLRLSPPERKRLEIALGFRPGRVQEDAAIEAVIRAIPALTERPTIAVVEGLHRAPPLLLKFLQTWHQSAGSLLVLGTARSGSFPKTVSLSKLSLEEARAWLEKRSPDTPEATRDRVVELADGLPGLMLKLLPAPSEERLAAMLQPHFDALGDAREVLLFAAHLPQPFAPEWLEAVFGVRAAAALRRIVDEGFLRETERGLVFQSQAYRRAAAALLPEARRRTGLKLLAEALLDQGRPQEAARFYAEAGLAGAAIRVLRALARKRQGAEALELLERAAALAKTPAQAIPVRLELAERLVEIAPYRALQELEGIQGPAADRRRALAYLQLGETEEAAHALLRYLQARPGDRAAWERFLEHAPAQVLVLASPPEDPQLAARLARRLEAAGMLTPAEVVYQQAYRRAEGNLAAEIAIALAGIAWRSFRPRDAKVWAQQARERARDPATEVLAEAFRGALSLDTGEIGPARELIARAARRLASLPCGEAFVRVAGIELRFLLETGRFDLAEAKGRGYFERCPHPWLGALLALTLAFQGKAAAAEALIGPLLPEADSPHTEALLFFTQGLVRAQRGGDPRPLYRLALRKANAGQNPYLKFLVLAALAIYYRRSEPRRTKAIADRILRQTWRQGYLPFLQLARLLKAEGARATGRRVAPLLRFESPFAVLEYWRRSLLKAEGHEPEPVPEEAVRGYGILGRFALANWKKVWTHGKKSAPESA